MSQVTNTQIYDALHRGECSFFRCQCDRNLEIVTVYCVHPAAYEDCEGNCNQKDCPTGRWNIVKEELSDGNQ